MVLLFQGGGLYLSSFQNVSISAVTLGHNSATKDGGNLLLESTGTATINQNTSIVSGSAGSAGGGALASYVDELVLDTVACTLNHARSLTGGCMSLENVNHLEATHVVWEDNVAATFGGACWLSGEWTSAKFNDCQFSGNDAGAGGGVWAKGSATASPANILVETDDTGEDDAKSTPDSIVAGARIEFTSANFLKNTADEEGGAVMISEVGSASLSYLNFAHNTASKVSKSCHCLILSMFFSSFSSQNVQPIAWILSEL